MSEKVHPSGRWITDKGGSRGTSDLPSARTRESSKKCQRRFIHRGVEVGSGRSSGSAYASLLEDEPCHVHSANRAQSSLHGGVEVGMTSPGSIRSWTLTQESKRLWLPSFTNPKKGASNAPGTTGVKPTELVGGLTDGLPSAVGIETALDFPRKTMHNSRSGGFGSMSSWCWQAPVLKQAWQQRKGSQALQQLRTQRFPRCTPREKCAFRWAGEAHATRAYTASLPTYLQ